VRIDRIYSRVQETSPIVRHDVIERVYYVIECISFDHRRGVLAAMEAPAEIVEREFPITSRSNQRISLQPDQRAFIVVINPAAIIHPGTRRWIGPLHGDRRIYKRTPLTARLVFHFRSNGGHRFAKIFRSPKSAASRQHFAKVL